MNYPTIAEVIAADQEQVSLWWHSLSDPKTPFEGTRDGPSLQEGLRDRRIRTTTTAGLDHWKGSMLESLQATVTLRNQRPAL